MSIYRLDSINLTYKQAHTFSAQRALLVCKAVMMIILLITGSDYSSAMIVLLLGRLLQGAGAVVIYD